MYKGTYALNYEEIFKTNQEIEKELDKRGAPLRWAVTKVDTEKQKAYVEAVIEITLNS